MSLHLSPYFLVLARLRNKKHKNSSHLCFLCFGIKATFWINCVSWVRKTPGLLRLKERTWVQFSVKSSFLNLFSSSLTPKWAEIFISEAVLTIDEMKKKKKKKTKPNSKLKALAHFHKKWQHFVCCHMLPRPVLHFPLLEELFFTALKGYANTFHNFHLTLEVEEKWLVIWSTEETAIWIFPMWSVTCQQWQISNKLGARPKI